RHLTHVRTLSVTAQGHRAPRDQFFPAIAADDRGHIHAIWFDNRDDPNDVLIRTWQADSPDGGLTWSSRDISTAPWNPNRSDFSCGCFIGDYNGIAAATTVVYPTWTDGRDSPGPPQGDTDLYTNVESPP